MKENAIKNYSNSVYNEEPVYYCNKCLSLRIRDIRGVPDTDYCDSCGGTNIQQTSIEEWETMFKNKYGFEYLKDY